MNAEQKQRIAQAVSNWRSYDLQEAETVTENELSAMCSSMAALLQEMVDAPEPEPVGYLYTNLQSGEYHVSDADDDYRGPERVLWCIEPVYRKTKGQS